MRLVITAERCPVLISVICMLMLSSIKQSSFGAQLVRCSNTTETKLCTITSPEQHGCQVNPPTAEKVIRQQTITVCEPCARRWSSR